MKDVQRLATEAMYLEKGSQRKRESSLLARGIGLCCVGEGREGRLTLT